MRTLGSDDSAHLVQSVMYGLAVKGLDFGDYGPQLLRPQPVKT